LNLVSLKDYYFWLAEYDETPSFAYDFQMWQYTDNGSVPGVEGPVDMNIAFQKREK
jgi:GH25 family lysozyme M1 (1,4-beta-N-acetylmuramidase)